MTTVDIIIPVYNVEPFLRRCLDSVVSQTCPLWRAICVDDGSTDGCGAILDSYAAADSRFKVIHQKNAGLSDARNAGMEVSDADYVMFIDSDDFIHPQTLEIALGLAGRDGSDVVSWYRDAIYRNYQVKLLRLFKRDTISAKPWGMKRRFNIGRIRSFTTDKLVEHCSDWQHPGRRNVLKHCFVWRHLFRRTAISDVRFIKGLKYEDIPWWSEVLLKPLNVTVTRLPLYYYYPNCKSIAKSTPAFPRAVDILTGISRSHLLYRSEATREQMAAWSHNIKWAILYGTASKICRQTAGEGGDKLKKIIREMLDNGVFDDAVTIKELWAKDCYLMAIGAIDFIPRPGVRRLKALRGLLPV